MHINFRIINIIWIVIVAALFSFGCSRNTDVPSELIGVWKTAAPNYADRFLAFDQYYVTLGLGAGEEISYIIKNIEAKRESSGTAFTFYYEDSKSEEWTLAFYYESSNGGLIMLNNSNNIWKKVNTGE